MSKRAAIAKATGVEANTATSDLSILGSQAVVELALEISAAIVSSSAGRKPRVSRSGCNLIALQLLIVAAGLRRGALIDALGLTAAQASAISLRLISFGKQKAQYNDLQRVRLLYHAPTDQTFIVSSRESLWTDVETLTGGTASEHLCPALWVDARSTPEHTFPTLAAPDAHTMSLITAIRKAVTTDNSLDVLIASQPLSEQYGSNIEAQVVGVALAGFLLEYGSVYCLHDIEQTPASCTYDVRPLHRMQRDASSEANFAAPPTNCLGSQPLIVYRVHWSDSTSKLELFSFSIPQCLCSDADVQKLRQALVDTFQSRVNSLQSSSTFASGSISVEMATVTLHQVAL
ncbi:uncharacterized protein UTRI_01497_B [Ustilago trichophora]|uniref:Uncharacterized protein n=1 Tax=Ustilago trichophora TaxID=86804 RepID=A0A5C3E5Y7_9BASI|nr:uncharacterized protein UTRI_01497_B [Ustilago trichophora]